MELLYSLYRYTEAEVYTGTPHSLLQSHEFLLFSFLMLLDMAVLAFMAIRYEYVDFTAGNNDSNGKNSAKGNAAITDDEDKID